MPILNLRTRQKIRAVLALAFLTVVVGGSIVDFAGLFGADFYRIFGVEFKMAYGLAISIGIALVCGVFILITRPELSPFLRGVQGGYDDLNNDFRVVDLTYSDRAISEIHRLAQKAFEGNAMDLAKIQELHGNSKKSVFLLKGGESDEVLGYFAIFFPTAETKRSMTTPVDSNIEARMGVNIDDWNPSDFVPIERLFENKYVYLESIVVLDPDPLNRKIKSRTLLAHATRFLLLEMEKQGIDLDLIFLGYSAPYKNREPGANLMKRLLKMDLVPNCFGDGMNLYKGKASKSELSDFAQKTETELFHLRALTKLKRQD